MAPSPRILASLSMCATLAVSGCDGSTAPPENAFDPPPPELAAVPTVSFRMWATVDVDQMNPVIPPPAPCLAFFNSVIEGRSTHLGRFAGVGTTCLLTQVVDPDPPFLPPGPAPYATADFTNPLWTLTSANGDELWIEGEGVAVFSLADGSLRGEGEQRIIGGTGRFDGATGVVQAQAINEDGQGPDDFESSGWIRFRASNRAAR